MPSTLSAILVCVAFGSGACALAARSWSATRAACIALCIVSAGAAVAVEYIAGIVVAVIMAGVLERLAKAQGAHLSEHASVAALGIAGVVAYAASRQFPECPWVVPPPTATPTDSLLAVGACVIGILTVQAFGRR